MGPARPAHENPGVCGVGYSISDFWIIVTFSKPPLKSDYVGLAAFHLASNALLFSAGLWWVSALWSGSLVTVFMMFFRLRLWLEHQGSDLANRLDLRPWEAALLAPHLSWHHWEHHQWPAVPYWNGCNPREASTPPI
jgi:hypothetical protein